MDTGSHNAPGDIHIDGNTYVVYEYCTNVNENGQCVERMQVVPYDSLRIQNEQNVESYTNTAVFVVVIMLLIWFVKGIFRLIIPTKWRRD